MSLFISLEGPDGSGKSLQMALLKEALSNAGYDFIYSREPGGTPIGEAIRDILLDPARREMSAECEAYLYAASRAQHVREKVLPALNEGKIVLLDRYVDSSLVYQGIGRDLGVEAVYELNQTAIGGILPDITFMVYIDYEEGIRRKQKQSGHDLDRLENEASAFHRKVNEGYLTIAKKFPERIKLIDGTKSVEKVHQDIWECLMELFEARGIHPTNETTL